MKIILKFGVSWIEEWPCYWKNQGKLKRNFEWQRITEVNSGSHSMQHLWEVIFSSLILVPWTFFHKAICFIVGSQRLIIQYFLSQTVHFKCSIHLHYHCHLEQAQNKYFSSKYRSYINIWSQLSSRSVALILKVNTPSFFNHSSYQGDSGPSLL